jgi:hypothetical protein
VFYQGGTGSNEVLTLAEVAERLEIDTVRPDRAVVRKLRALEKQTGRVLLVASGEGKGRRYMVLGRELDAALEGEAKADIGTLADRIAAAVQRIEDRVERVSLDVAALARRVDRLEQVTAPSRSSAA